MTLSGDQFAEARADKTVRPANRMPGARAAVRRHNKALQAAAHRRRYKAKKRRHGLRTHRAAVAYGSQHIPVSPILSLTFRKVDALKVVRFTAISGDRRAGVAERFGHSSQAYLYHQYQAGVPGFLPANPPGESSHEYRNGGPSGGPAYPRLPIGVLLEPQQLGIDLSSNAEASEFCDRVHDIGLHFFQPYPTGSELHHICCRMPMDQLIQWLIEHKVIR